MSALPGAANPETGTQRTNRILFILTAVLLLLVVVLLPLAVISFRDHVFVTLEDNVSRLSMAAPVPVDPASVRSPGASDTFFAVDRVSWQRPLYLRMLTILLVVLIAASAVFALSLKDLEDLLLGIGGIILGVWGVRSIVVQTALPDLTWVDIALALIILLLLLTLAIPAARRFYRLSGFGGTPSEPDGDRKEDRG